MIDSLLHYGYNPACARVGLSENIVTAVNAENLSGDHSSLIEKGIQAFEQSVNAELESLQGDEAHFVPISAGLDSRAILAALLNNSQIETTSITTFTFGIPDTWDFEIGQRVANFAGVNNTTIDLTSDVIDWSEQALQRHATKLSCQTRIFESYINHQLADYIDDEAVVWSGFLGETTAGSHQPKNPSDDWQSACDYFIKHNRFSKTLAQLVEKPGKDLPHEPYLPKEQLSYEEQLDFAHRQQCFISPLVLSNDATYATPFTQPSWLKYSLNLPFEYRANRSIFVDMVTKAYPKLFSLPSDYRHGLPPTAGQLRWYTQLAKLFVKLKLSQFTSYQYVYPGTNYLDFESVLREEGQLRNTVESLVFEFDERNVKDIDAVQLWNEHQNGANREKALRTICSIELLFRTRA